MRNFAMIALLGLFTANLAAAAVPACDAKAAEKKLAGAAKNSFLKKCEKDSLASAQTTCEGKAKDKKLNGAAKNSFVKKCVKDAGAA